MDLVTAGGMQVARTLYEFVNDEAIPGTGIEPTVFWQGFGALVRDLAPRNKALLDRRDELQRQIDAWHLEQRGKPMDLGAYTEFLRGIGYLQPEPAGLLDRHRQRRSRDRQHRRPAARRAGDQRALCAECGERALGQPVRCAVRHRCHPRGWRRHARTRLQRRPRRTRDRQGTPGPGPGGAARHRQPSRCDALRDRRWPAHGHAEGSCAGPGSRGRSSSSAIAATPATRRPCC